MLPHLYHRVMRMRKRCCQLTSSSSSTPGHLGDILTGKLNEESKPSLTIRGSRGVTSSAQNDGGSPPVQEKTRAEAKPEDDEDINQDQQPKMNDDVKD